MGISETALAFNTNLPAEYVPDQDLSAIVNK